MGAARLNVRNANWRCVFEPARLACMFGSHLSISGGMHNALLAAEKYGMETVQVFTNI
jgi:hypothetical protein